MTTEPSIVDVRVPITSPNKTIPIRVKREGELPDGMSLESLELEPAEATIYGPQDVIDSINVLDGIVLDLSEISDGETIEQELSLPTGVERVEPETVQITPHLAEEAESEWLKCLLILLEKGKIPR